DPELSAGCHIGGHSTLREPSRERSCSQSRWLSRILLDQRRKHHALYVESHKSLTFVRHPGSDHETADRFEADIHEPPQHVADLLGSAAVVAVAAGLVKKGGMGGGGVSAALRFDDKEILRFVKENGGRAIEAEIRERFSIPRTSAWRQARRLEKLGFVKISK